MPVCAPRRALGTGRPCVAWAGRTANTASSSPKRTADMPRLPAACSMTYALGGTDASRAGGRCSMRNLDLVLARGGCDNHGCDRDGGAGQRVVDLGQLLVGLDLWPPWPGRCSKERSASRNWFGMLAISASVPPTLPVTFSSVARATPAVRQSSFVSASGKDRFAIGSRHHSLAEWVSGGDALLQFADTSLRNGDEAGGAARARPEERCDDDAIRGWLCVRSPTCPDLRGCGADR